MQKKTVKSKATQKSGKIKPTSRKAPVKKRATLKPPPSRRTARGDKVEAVDYAQFEKKLTDVAVKISEFADAACKELANPDQPAARLAHIYSAMRRTSTALKYAIGMEGDDKLRSGSLLDNIRVLNEDTIPKAFEREGVTSFNTDDGYRVTTGQKYYASIKGDRKMDAYEWLVSNGLSALIIETVNSSTLSAAGKHLIEEKGKELPEDLFNAYFKNNTSLTKIGKGKK